MPSRQPRPRTPRRGVTLVEMLVAVALLVLMMSVLVTVFTAATGALSGLRTYQELDGKLRSLYAVLTTDLQSITCHVTPATPNNQGYLEYGENAFADLQGEDTDDYIRFTTKAPEGQFFIGRVWIGPAVAAGGVATLLNQPVLVTSPYAEIIYFLRNGNLYRRVLLISPDRQLSVQTGALTLFQAGMVSGLNVSWQGVNDLSARPSTAGTLGAITNPITLNTLADLANRENRAFYPRFADDFVANGTGAAAGAAAPGDGISDDENGVTAMISPPGDGVHDYYPTLYPSVFSATPGLVFETVSTSRFTTFDAMPFPYVFPGAYSKPDPTAGAGTASGWIHSLDPTAFANGLTQLMQLNHAPLFEGDNLPQPGLPQTWWGFPTWRETLSPSWQDPAFSVASALAAGGTAPSQANALHPFSPVAVPPAFAANNVLPPMLQPTRTAEQPFNDGAGSATFGGATVPLWYNSWEDDLVMTNVRSFDIKALDQAFAGYVDLGWGDDLRLYQQYTSITTPPFQSPAVYPGTNPTSFPLALVWPPNTTAVFDLYGQTFAHEGRIPPMTGDHRLDPQALAALVPGGGAPFWYPGGVPFAAFSGYSANVGDDQAAVVRLRRVWDSWSTEYTNAPNQAYDPTTKLKYGLPGSPPPYPSYPPPYPAPLRGIQIQIRVVDPKNERIKTLTIRHDFSDRL